MGARDLRKRGAAWLVCAAIVGATGVMSVASTAGAALDPAGETDTTYDGDGATRTNMAIVDTFAEARGLGLQKVGTNAGKVVIVGGYQDGFDFHVSMLRLNPDGTQDTAFGKGGEVKTTVGENDLAEDAVIQSDDKVVVAGFSDNRAMVLRYLPDGAVDDAFGGGDGVVTFSATEGKFARVGSVALQSDGKILVAGYGEVSAATGRDIMIARLTTAGTLDASFGGGDGIATLSLTSPDPSPDPSPPFVGGTDRARGLAVQSDGKIVFVGQTTNPAGSTCNTVNFADFQSVIGRLNADGSLDTSFDGDGHRTVGLGTTSNCPDDGFRDVVVQADGRLVAVGYANTTMDQATNAKNNVSVARFTSNGSFDNTFSGDGRLSTAISSTTSFLSDVAEEVHVQSDGRILVGAYSDDGTDNGAGTVISQNNFAALRYTSDGTLDTSFGGDGIGEYDFSQNDTFDAMVVDASGRPVLAGYSYVAGQFVDPLLAVARVKTDGALDTSFNGTGTFFKKLQGNSVELGAGVARQASGANAGKLVVVGSTDAGSHTDVALVRYTTGGALDTSFSDDGKATGDDSGRNDAPNGVAVQADDKLVVVGTNYGTSGRPRATVMRFNANSGLDTTFGGGGISSIEPGSNANEWNAVTLQSDGKIVVGGTVSNMAADWNLMVGRYNTNGSLDGSFGSNGVFQMSTGGFDEIKAVAVQKDGKILAGGSTFLGQKQHFVLLRFTTSGALDSSFGGGDGQIITQTGNGQFPRNEITGIAIQDDGRIVVGGNGNDGGGNTNNVIRLVRYLPNGDLDTSFGTDGVVTTNLANDRFDRVGGIALQHDEKIVVFGHTQQLFVTRDDYLIARYNWDDGSLDTTYGQANQGYSVVAATVGSDQAGGGLLFPNGSAAIGGTTGNSDLGAARIHGDPAPVMPGAPSLAPASDTGSSASDRITKDNTPTIIGTCNTGETTILRINGSLGTPLSRSLCRNSAHATTAANAVADGVHRFVTFSRNGAGDTGDTTSVSVTVDTVADAPVITSPNPAAVSTIPPAPTISGTVNETIAGAVVEVREGNQLVCTATADAAGAWSCSATNLRPGAHTITARQTDVAGNVSAESATRDFTLKAMTTTEIAVSPVRSVFGQAVTFTATVSAVPASLGPPDGSVNFHIGNRAPQSVALIDGVATLTVPAGGSATLPVGSHDVGASYAGSVGYFDSNVFLMQPHVVDKAQTTVTWSAPSSPSARSAPPTFTATVAAVAPGAGAPTGELDIIVDGGAATAVPLVDGVATLENFELPVGEHRLVARFTGDGSFEASSAEVAHEVVNVAPETGDASFTGRRDTELQRTLSGLASDGDNDPLRFALVADPAHGTAVIDANGTFRYMPAAGFVGTDAFTYRVDDGWDTAEGQVTITITKPAATHPGPGEAIPGTGTEGAADPYPSTITVSEVPGSIVDARVSLDGLVHPNAADLNIALQAPNGHTVVLMSGCRGGDDVDGTLTFSDDGQGLQSAATDTDLGTGVFAPSGCTEPTFDPSAPHCPCGDSFARLAGANPNGTWSLFVFDDSPDSAGTLAGWTLELVTNAAPQADDGSFTLTSGAELHDTVASLATDADGDELSFELVTPPAHGTVTVNRDGAFSYDPPAGFVGVDTFTYRAGDGAEADQGEVTVTVTDDSGPQAHPTLSPEPNADGWNQSDVTVTWNWADGATGVDTAHCTAATVSNGEGELTLTATCRDLAGNETTASQIVQVDKSRPQADPTLSPKPNAGGWNRRNVTVTWNWADGTSGVAPAHCTAETVSSGEGELTLTAACRDLAGNEATASQDVRIDTSGPTATITAPTAKHYLQGAVVTADYRCADHGSGIAACTGSVADGAPIDTTVPGNHVFTVTARDRAGHESAATVSYIVVARPTCGGRPATIIGTPGDDVLIGTASDDVIATRGGRDRISARGGNDTICTGVIKTRGGGHPAPPSDSLDRADVIFGGPGNDTILAGNGSDTIRGGGGDDSILAGGGRDTALGGSGNDTIGGGPGRDTLAGGAGNDQFRGGPRKDTCRGGTGTDRAIGCERTVGIP